MATHSTLVWRIPGTEELDGLPSMGSHRVGHDWRELAAAAPYLAPLTYFCIFHHGRGGCCREKPKGLFSQGTMWNVNVGPEVLDFTFEVKSHGNMNCYSWPHLSLKLLRQRKLWVHLYLFSSTHMGFPDDSVISICLVMQETWVSSLGWEDLLEEEMATHSSILAWKIHGQRSLAGYSPRGSQRVGHDWEQHPYTHTFVLVLFISTKPQTAWKSPLRKWFLYSQDVCVSGFSPHPQTLQFSRHQLGLITHFWHELPSVSLDPTDWLSTTGLPTSITQFRCQLQVPGCELYFWPTGHKLEVLTPHSQSSEKHFIYVEWFIIKNITEDIKCIARWKGTGWGPKKV